MAQYQSYAFTFRPRDGVTEGHIAALMKYVRRKCQYYYVVTEKLDTERHIHAGLFLSRPVKRSNLSNELKRLFPHLEDDEKRVLQTGIRIMYNMDFIDEYLNKEDDTEVIATNLPEVAHLDSYFPPELEQRKAMADKATDKFYAKLEHLWWEHVKPGTEINRDSCCDFLWNMMYSKRVIRVMRDDRAIKMTATHLMRYMLKSTRSSYEWAPWE